MPGFKTTRRRCPFCDNEAYIKNKSNFWIKLMNSIWSIENTKIINHYKCKKCGKWIWCYRYIPK